MRVAAYFAAGIAWVLGFTSAAADEATRVSIVTRTAATHEPGEAANLRVDVRLVLIPVTVTDPFGAPFAGLRPEVFRLFENGVEQRIRYFSSEDAPVSLGIVFDSSRSMQGKLDQSRAAITEFFNSSIGGNEYFVVEFNDAPRLLCDFTTETAQIEQALVGIMPRNWTALLDAVYMAIQHMKHARNPRKALLVLSDGGDNNSRYTEREMKSLVREADVCIYSIALVGGGLMRRHVPSLKQLATETGGRIREVEKMNDLPAAIAVISAAIRHQYLLGYSPNNSTRHGLYRKVQVRLDQPKDLPRLRASWRQGYYAQ
jgi:Ca-activated chloride channel family protein